MPKKFVRGLKHCREMATEGKGVKEGLRTRDSRKEVASERKRRENEARNVKKVKRKGSY